MRKIAKFNKITSVKKVNSGKTLRGVNIKQRADVHHTFSINKIVSEKHL
jgi:hypothetical protein